MSLSIRAEFMDIYYNQRKKKGEREREEIGGIRQSVSDTRGATCGLIHVPGD